MASGDSCQWNHHTAWPEVAGSGPSRGTRSIDGRLVTWPDACKTSICSANSASPGEANSVTSGKSTENVLADPRDQPHGQQRMATQLEKVVVGADALQPQQVGPDGRQLPLGVGTRGDVAMHRPRRRRHHRQGRAVHLAAGQLRQGVENLEHLRNHVVGQRGAQEATQLLDEFRPGLLALRRWPLRGTT